jgi:hypothetical protein
LAVAANRSQPLGERREVDRGDLRPPEIQDLQVAYSHAIDFKNFDELDDVFTPDAHIDYTVFGGPKGSYPEIKKYLSDTMPMFSGYYHLVATSRDEQGHRRRRHRHRRDALLQPDGAAPR